MSRLFDGFPPVVALRDCSLRIWSGDFIAVTGPSGSGKSTFLNVLGLLDRPTSGSHFLEGLDVAALNERGRTAIRGRRIGFVFQDFQLLDQRTALENVMMATLYTGTKESAAHISAMGALESVGLGGMEGELPSHMSGGERQRVAIARALAGNPSLLLCDEPTGNLDSATAATVLDLVTTLNRSGATIVLITHDSELAKHASRWIEIRDGVMTEPARLSRRE